MSSGSSLETQTEDNAELHGMFVGVAEPLREVGVEFGDLVVGEDEVVPKSIDERSASHVRLRVSRSS